MFLFRLAYFLDALYWSAATCLLRCVQFKVACN